MWEIYSIGDSAYLAAILNAVAMITGTGDFRQLAGVGFLIGVLLVLFQGILQGGRGIRFQNVLVAWLLFGLLNRAARQTKTQFDDRFLAAIGSELKWLLVLLLTRYGFLRLDFWSRFRLWGFSFGFMLGLWLVLCLSYLFFFWRTFLAAHPSISGHVGDPGKADLHMKALMLCQRIVDVAVVDQAQSSQQEALGHFFCLH